MANMTATQESRASRQRQRTAGRSGDDIEILLEINRKHSELFTNAAEADERHLYRQRHRTEIAASKCMDGRLHLPVLTETPMGIIQPFRNIGGKFDLSWPLYQEAMLDWHDYAISRQCRCLQLVTYHFSRGEKNRGCRGFDYDRTAAQEYTAGLKRQFDEDFGRAALYAVHCGVETDYESLILHGDRGASVDLADVSDSSTKAVRQMLEELYQDMSKEILKDFVPLVQGNIRHSAEVRADQERNLEVDAEHQEWVLGIGRGFDWLHEINMALLVGPFDPNRRQVIKAAAELIYKNFEAGRTNGHEIVLLSTAFFREVAGPERNLKARKALGLQQEALEVIRESVPGLLPHLQVLTIVVDINTRAIAKILARGRATGF